MVIKPPVEVIDGRYELGPVIGRGAMGEVRRGRDVRLGREVAVKFLRADLAAAADVRSRFEDEARAAARLSHSAIVTVFDSGEWDGVPYLVMECLPGRTLADELAGGPLPAERVRAIGVEVAGALATAHDLGVIHRDVKPGNILLTDSGAVKLADFGIAKSTETLDLTLTGMIVGTPAYLAPERLAGQPATARSDVYSLGVVLYEALTGEKPFCGDTPIALAHAIHTTSPQPVASRLPATDLALASAIDRAMAKDPAQRHTSASDLAASLSSGMSPTRSSAAVAGPAGTATQILPTMPSETALVPQNPEMARALGWWRVRSTGERQALGAVVAAVLLVLIALAWPTGDDDPQTPPVAPTSTPTVPLPDPLDDAIRQLEESVQP